MKNKLIDTSQDRTLSGNDAFIFMIITYGEKDNISLAKDAKVLSLFTGIDIYFCKIFLYMNLFRISY
jgi:hypothetical protein